MVRFDSSPRSQPIDAVVDSLIPKPLPWESVSVEQMADSLSKALSTCGSVLDDAAKHMYGRWGIGKNSLPISSRDISIRTLKRSVDPVGGAYDMETGEAMIFPEDFLDAMQHQFFGLRRPAQSFFTLASWTCEEAFLHKRVPVARAHADSTKRFLDIHRETQDQSSVLRYYGVAPIVLPEDTTVLYHGLMPIYKANGQMHMGYSMADEMFVKVLGLEYMDHLVHTLYPDVSANDIETAYYAAAGIDFGEMRNFAPIRHLLQGKRHVISQYFQGTLIEETMKRIQTSERAEFTQRVDLGDGQYLARKFSSVW